MKIDSKEMLWMGGGGGEQSKQVSRGHAPTPRKEITPKDQIYAIRGYPWGQFYGNKVYFFLCTATDWNHLSDDQVKAPPLQDF